MKKISIALALFCAACSLPEQGSKATVFDRSVVQKSVETLLNEWSAAGAEGRWDDLKAVYADDPDFVWIENGAVAYKDHAAVVTGVDRVASMNAILRSEFGDIVVTPLGADAAAFHATVGVGFVSPEFSFDFAGVFTGVAIQRNGRWLFLQGHLSRPDVAPQ